MPRLRQPHAPRDRRRRRRRLDYREHLDRASSVGVRGVVQVGTDLETSRWSAEIAAREPRVLAAVAIHPNEAPARGRGRARRRARRDRRARRPAARPRRRRDRPRLLPHRRRRAARRSSSRSRRTSRSRSSTASPCRSTTATPTTTSSTTLLRVGAPERTVFHCFSRRRRAREHLRRERLVRVVRRHRDVQERRSPCATRSPAAPRNLIMVETDAPYLTPTPVPRSAERALPDPATPCGRWPRPSAPTSSMLAAQISSTTELVYGTLGRPSPSRSRADGALRPCSAPPRSATSPTCSASSRPRSSARTSSSTPTPCAASSRSPGSRPGMTRRRDRPGSRLADPRPARGRRSVVAVEIDKRLAEQLPKTVRAAAAGRRPHRRRRRRHARRRALPAEPTHLVANLPYNVSVPVLLHFLEHFPSLTRGLVMVQAEVGLRLAAEPGLEGLRLPEHQGRLVRRLSHGRAGQPAGVLAGAERRLHPRRLRPARAAGHRGRARRRRSSSSTPRSSSAARCSGSRCRSCSASSAEASDALEARASRRPRAARSSRSTTSWRSPGCARPRDSMTPPKTPASGGDRRPRGLSDARLASGTGAVPPSGSQILDGPQGDAMSHAQIAAPPRRRLRGPAWWAQGITVRYEQARGVPAPGRQPDGTYAVTVSRSLPGEPLDLFDLAVDRFTRYAGGPPEVVARSATRPTADGPSARRPCASRWCRPTVRRARCRSRRAASACPNGSSP